MDSQYSEKIKNLENLLDELKNYGKQLQFEKSEKSNYQQTATLITIGDTGNGKSELNTNLMYCYSELPETSEKFDKKKHRFQSKKNGSSVTKKVAYKKIGNLKIIDTPGTNDTDNSLSDKNVCRMQVDFLKEKQIADEENISGQILKEEQIADEENISVETLKEITFINDEGISGIVQCIMVNNSGRIQKTSILSMTKQLLQYSYMYENFDVENCPRLNVVFTDFSINQDEQTQNIGLSSDSDQEFQQKKEDIFKEMQKKYKEFLIEELVTEYKSFDPYFIQNRIDELFKSDNFYCYQLQKNKQKWEKEQLQIQRLLKENIKNGQYKLHKDQVKYFVPYTCSVKERKIITDNQNNLINFPQQQLRECLKHQNKEEEKQNLRKIFTMLQDVESKKQDVVDKYSHIILKTPLDTMKQFNDCIRDIYRITNQIIIDQMFKINPQQGEIIYEKIKKKQEDVTNQQKNASQFYTIDVQQQTYQKPQITETENLDDESNHDKDCENSDSAIIQNDTTNDGQQSDKQQNSTNDGQQNNTNDEQQHNNPFKEFINKYKYYILGIILVAIVITILVLTLEPKNNKQNSNATNDDYENFDGLKNAYVQKKDYYYSKNSHYYNFERINTNNKDAVQKISNCTLNLNEYLCSSQKVDKFKFDDVFKNYQALFNQQYNYKVVVWSVFNMMENRKENQIRDGKITVCDKLMHTRYQITNSKQQNRRSSIPQLYQMYNQDDFMYKYTNKQTFFEKWLLELNIEKYHDLLKHSESDGIMTVELKDNNYFQVKLDIIIPNLR